MDTEHEMDGKRLSFEGIVTDVKTEQDVVPDFLGRWTSYRAGRAKLIVHARSTQNGSSAELIFEPYADNDVLFMFKDCFGSAGSAKDHRFRITLERLED